MVNHFSIHLENQVVKWFKRTVEFRFVRSALIDELWNHLKSCEIISLSRLSIRPDTTIPSCGFLSSRRFSRFVQKKSITTKCSCLGPLAHWRVQTTFTPKWASSAMEQSPVATAPSNYLVMNVRPTFHIFSHGKTIIIIGLMVWFTVYYIYISFLLGDTQIRMQRHSGHWSSAIAAVPSWNSCGSHRNTCTALLCSPAP